MKLSNSKEAAPGKPLMPQATAVWLIQNTTLTIEQIAESCGLYVLEVQTLADDENPNGIKGESPLLSDQLTQAEIDRCTQDPSARLRFQSLEDVVHQHLKKGGGHYLPLTKRSDRPDGIAWVLKNYPEFTDHQIAKLLHTTLKTVKAVRSRTHANTANIKPRHPVLLQLCSAKELDALVDKVCKSSPKETS